MTLNSLISVKPKGLHNDNILSNFNNHHPMIICNCDFSTFIYILVSSFEFNTLT